jgi:hypothetical protein
MISSVFFGAALSASLAAAYAPGLELVYSLDRAT